MELLREVTSFTKNNGYKRKRLTSHIWRVGSASNNPQLAAWGHDSRQQNSIRKNDRSLSKNMEQKGAWRNYGYENVRGSENRMSLKIFLHIYSVKSKRDEEKEYKKIAKKEKKKKRNKMLKHQTPKEDEVF